MAGPRCEALPVRSNRFSWLCARSGGGIYSSIDLALLAYCPWTREPLGMALMLASPSLVAGVRKKGPTMPGSIAW